MTVAERTDRSTVLNGPPLIAANRTDPDWQGPPGYEFAVQFEETLTWQTALAKARRVLHRGTDALLLAPGHWADYVNGSGGRSEPRWVPHGWSVYRKRSTSGDPVRDAKRHGATRNGSQTQAGAV